MWSGPIISEEDKGSVNDDPLETVAAALAVRRTSLEEAETLVAGFAAASTENRNERLAHLFTNAFDRINNERAQLIGGISRYAERQSGLAQRIDELNEKLVVMEAKEDKTNDEFDAFEELADKIDWDTRIFDERQQSLTYVCETPVILEKRAFALARIIMNHLE
jgi:chromosome segregation ATPase